MEKRIRVEDLNLGIYTGELMYMKIDIFRFLYDKEIFCLTVEILDDENYEFYEEIELPEETIVIDYEDLKKAALGWILQNVEIVKNTEKEVLNNVQY